MASKTALTITDRLASAVAFVAVGSLLPFALMSNTSSHAASTSPRPKPASSSNAPATKPAQKGDSGPARSSFGVQPATNNKPDARPSFSYGATPGGQISDQVAVINIGVTPVTVRLYVTDATSTSNGTFDLLPGAKKPTDVGAWAQLASGEKLVTVPARSQAVVAMKIVIPKDASPGDHTGGVIASLETQARNAAGDTVTLEQRVASRLRIRVSGELKPKLLIEKMSATYQGSSSPVARGKMQVKYTIRNSGNVRLTGKQVLTVKGLFGPTAVATDLVDVPELLPGSSFVVSSVVSDVMPAFRLTATATVTPVSRPEDVNPALAVATRSVSVWAIPWLILALLLIVILGTVGLRRRSKRKSDNAAKALIAERNLRDGTGGGAEIISTPAGATSALGERNHHREDSSDQAGETSARGGDRS